MSLPEFSTQSNLFSTAALSGSLFPENDRYRLFATLVYPHLVKARTPLAACYCADDGRVAVEPVLLLGVSVLQFLDGLPDRAAVEMLRYHAGWNFALNRQVGDPLFHSTTLVNFRQRLIDHDQSAVAFQSILVGLVQAGLVARQARQRLDSTQIFGRISRMSRLECVRETLRLALEELEITAAGLAKPECWTPTPNFITAVVRQPATSSDDAGLPLVEQEQALMGMEKPGQWYVDGAYVSAERLAEAKAEGREIIGPAQASPTRDGRFKVEKFQISVEERTAICPAGKTSTQGSRLEVQETGKVNYRFEFSTHCHDCPLRGQCLGKDQKHRTILVGQHHTVLQARRTEQKTEEFKIKARRRNAIEGTQSELVRAHGLRRARYRGLARMRLQSYLAAAACNLKRWIRRTAWELAQNAPNLTLEAENPSVA